MRVGFEVSALRQTRAGTARYIRGLLQQLESSEIEVARFAFGGPGRLAALTRDTAWYLAALPVAVRRARVDLLHCPTYRAPLRSPVPLVVTVLDLAVFRFPEAFNRWTRNYSRALVPAVVRAANRIIAISHFTKRELVEVLDVSPDKVSVTQLAVEPVFHPHGSAVEGDYVLAVGTLEPRKNLPQLAEATRRLGIELRVVGATGWGHVDIGGGGVRWLGEVPDAQLAELYRGARCLAYPSLYEGFGFPVLEAMACGTPVVTSAGGATEEIAGGAAVLVDPLDATSIGAGIEEAAERRQELAALGRERARAFSWERTAAATAAVYRELAAD